MLLFTAIMVSNTWEAVLIATGIFKVSLYYILVDLLFIILNQGCTMALFFAKAMLLDADMILFESSYSLL